MATLNSILSVLLLAGPASAEFAQTCLAGGPHTFTPRTNDTIASIATLFQVAYSAIETGQTVYPDVNTVVTDGQVKIEQCFPSQCEIQPFYLQTTDLAALAAEYNTTEGQIRAYNPTGPFDEVINTSAYPVIAMPMNCVNLSSTVTIGS